MAKKDSKRKTGLKGAALSTLRTINPSQIRNAAWLGRRQLAGKVNPRLLNMLRIGRLGNVPGSAAGGLGLALGAGAAIGTAMEKNLPVSKFVSGRGAGRGAFSSQLKINAEREVKEAAKQVQRDEAFKEQAFQQLTDGTIAKTIEQFNQPSAVKPGEITVDPSLDDQKGVNTKWMPPESFDISNGMRTGTDISNQPPNQFQQNLTTTPQAQLKIQDPGSNWVGRGTDVRMPDGGSTVLTEHSGDFKWKNLKAGDQLGVMTRNERKAYDKAAKAAQAKVVKTQMQIFNPEKA